MSIGQMTRCILAEEGAHVDELKVNLEGRSRRFPRFDGYLYPVLCLCIAESRTTECELCLKRSISIL